MRDIALFGEDYAHRQIVGALVQRLAALRGIEARLDWRNAVGGHGKVAEEFGRYLRDLARQGGHAPDAIIVATDANCRGGRARAREFQDREAPARMVLAIPEPHIERWLLLDGGAFQKLFGRGCDAPDLKCDRGRYKSLLATAIRNTGIEASLGGVEYAEDIVGKMSLKRAKKVDKSFRRFVEAVDNLFRGWRS